jgi:hypothetical protein
MEEPVDRSKYPARLRHLHDPEDDGDIQRLTPAQRMEMVWQLTLQTWAFKEGLAVEPRLRRDVVRVVRGKG